MKQKSTSGVKGPGTASGVSLGLQDAWSAPVATEGDRAVNSIFCLFEWNSPSASPTLSLHRMCLAAAVGGGAVTSAVAGVFI